MDPFTIYHLQITDAPHKQFKIQNSAILYGESI